MGIPEDPGNPVIGRVSGDMRVTGVRLEDVLIFISEEGEETQHNSLSQTDSS